MNPNEIFLVFLAIASSLALSDDSVTSRKSSRGEIMRNPAAIAVTSVNIEHAVGKSGRPEKYFDSVISTVVNGYQEVRARALARDRHGIIHWSTANLNFRRIERHRVSRYVSKRLRQRAPREVVTIVIYGNNSSAYRNTSNNANRGRMVVENPRISVAH